MIVVSLLICLLLHLLLLAGCEEEKAETETETETETVKQLDEWLVKGNNSIGLELLTEIYKEEGEGNLFISPTSISLVLSMIYVGSSDETKKEMAEALWYENIDLNRVNNANADLLALLKAPDDRVTIELANSIWKREGIEFCSDFIETNHDYYKAEIKSRDFTEANVAKEVNSWVEENTGGHIKGLLDHIDPQTIMILINALYFSADWTDSFDVGKTQESVFYSADEKEIKVPMMFRADYMEYMEKDGFQAIRLPYGSAERVGMYIFLPDEDSSLDDFYRHLTSENIEMWIEEFEEIEGELQMPKFEINYDVKLKSYLNNIGVSTLFCKDNAKFGNMLPETEERLFFVDDIRHRTYVRVDEKGTEAAAVTEVPVEDTSSLDFFMMAVNRPFFFTVRDDVTGALLFVGSVTDPS